MDDTKDTRRNGVRRKDDALVDAANATDMPDVAALSSEVLVAKRESDSDGGAAEDDEDDDVDDDGDGDPARLMAIADDDGSFVQCAGMEPAYESWEDFHRAMDEYCVATHQPMRLRTSDSAKAVNGRAAKRNSLKEPIDESVGFVKKLYLCTHGVKAKPRGKGKRPRQHYRYMGCPAMIRACISERKPGEGIGKNKYVVRVVAQVRASRQRLLWWGGASLGREREWW